MVLFLFIFMSMCKVHFLMRLCWPSTTQKHVLLKIIRHFPNLVDLIRPISQERSLQKFQLPEPALCIGGYLKIELLGRVQKQEMDDKYYIWLAVNTL